MSKTRNAILSTLGLCLLFLGAVACETDTDDAARDDVTATTMDGTAQLTQEEREAGWEPLFEGDSLDGWRGYRSDSLPAKWQIVDGVLHLDPEAEGEGGDLMTAEKYENFDLSFDWKIAECGNSGVIYLIEEREDYPSTYMTGPEYQVIDDACYGELSPAQMAASNYDMIPPSTDVSRPAGEWNTGRIVKSGDTVQHWLNGEMVVEYELGSDEWKELVAGSKFQQWPGYGEADEGYIAFQNHGNEVWYRNVRIHRMGAQAFETE